MKRLSLAQMLGRRKMPSIVRRIMLGLVVGWLALVAGMSWWMSQRAVTTELGSLAASAEYEALTTGRVIDRLFTEMVSVTNMVARQGQVVQLASRYHTDPPGLAELTRKQRATQFTRDPLVRKVGDYMNALSQDLGYARIYLNNTSYDTVTASNWAESDSIVGMIYEGRSYLTDALHTGNGHLFGIARLNKTAAYFVSSRVEDANDLAQGVVTVKFDAPDMALYLTGRHIALIVDAYGRVTTTSSAPFMLRNIAALLPPGTVLPPRSDEDPGKPMDAQLMAASGPSDQWLIEGKPYLLRIQPLRGTQYRLLTLASLDHLPAMRSRHILTAGLVAILGLALIWLSSHVVGQIVLRHREERYAANYDTLTGLPNRRAVMRELDRLFALARREQTWVLMAFIDLDEFKTINDTYGHEIGDKLLIEVGRRLSTGLRKSDMLGRFGGDEFVVIGLADPSGPGGADQIAEAVRSRLTPLLKGTYTFGTCSFTYSGGSLGVISVDPSISSAQEVLRNADRLMYADKVARRTS